MMILVNGQIFIKKKPEVKSNLALHNCNSIRIVDNYGEEIISCEDDVDSFLDSLINVTVDSGLMRKMGDGTYLIYGKKYNQSVVYEVFEKFFLKRNVISKDTSLDFFKNRGFYRLGITNDGLMLINRTINVSANVDDLDKFNEDYLSLDDYFKHALYIGRKVKISGYEAVVLYESEGLYLISCNNCYSVINRHDFLIDATKLGEIFCEYIDKDTLYKEIVKQELMSGKGRNGWGYTKRK